MIKKILKKIWTDPLTTGIFTKLGSLGGMPWASDVDSNILDIHYYYQRSGEKPTSPLVNSLLIGDELTDADKTTLATVAKAHYLSKWNRLYELAQSEYNPIENYNMIEEEKEEHTESIDTTTRDTGTTTNQETRNLADTVNEIITHDTTDSNRTDVTYGKQETTTFNEATTGSEGETVTISDTKNTTINDSDSGETGIYGFNSSNDVGSTTSSNSKSGSTRETDSGTNSKQGTTSGTKTGTDTIANSGSDITTDATTHTGTDTTATTGSHTGTDTNTQTDNRQRQLDDDRAGDSERTLTRRGNIGVTTTAQMITGEIELWQWNFFESVMKDIDKLLTLSVYY